MKKIVTIVVLICMLSVVLSGCGNSTVALGTYQNENNAEGQVIITENTIQFVNVSFDEFNEELRQNMGVDLHLTNFMSDENTYTVKDGFLSVDIGWDIAISFEYGKDYIIVNEEKFKLS